MIVSEARIVKQSCAEANGKLKRSVTVIIIVIIISDMLGGSPFSSTDFQGVLHNKNYKKSIQYLRSNKENLERSYKH